MTFLTMQQELADRLGAYDETKTDDATKLKRWLNMGQQYICGKLNWPFMLAYEVIQTVIDITAGTVSVPASSTALTFSSAPSVSVANRYIQLSSSDDWYKIASHAASSTSATLDTAFVGTSDSGSVTYKVRKLLYATATPLDSILDMKKTVTPNIVQSISQRNGDFFLPLYLDAGDPYAYVMGPLDSSGNLQFSFVQSPDTVINILMRGINKLADLSASGDTPIIPTRWHDAIVDVAAHYGFIGTNEARAKESIQLASVKIADMARVFNTDLGRHRVMNSLDDGVDFGPTYQLPPAYGKMYW